MRNLNWLNKSSNLSTIKCSSIYAQPRNVVSINSLAKANYYWLCSFIGIKTVSQHFIGSCEMNYIDRLHELEVFHRFCRFVLIFWFNIVFMIMGGQLDGLFVSLAACFLQINWLIDWLIDSSSEESSAFMYKLIDTPQCSFNLQVHLHNPTRSFSKLYSINMCLTFFCRWLQCILR